MKINQLIPLINTIIFCVTFYFTVVRYITQIKIFHSQLNNLHSSFGLKDNIFWVIIHWLMWWYQIYFWFHYIKII